jgi:YfiH family protein
VSLPVWRASALEGVAHGFLGRQGGVSTGAMASLNCGWGSGDELALIVENRRRAAEAVWLDDVSRLASTRTEKGDVDPRFRSSRAQSRDVPRIVSPHQTHSADVVEAGEWPDDQRPPADAVVTDRPGILLGILTADCAPVLLADPQAGVVAAAHAGWKGALAGITDRTIEAMKKLGADRSHIAAAVGPCIAQRSYEVDWAFLERFTATDPANERFFAEGPAGKPHFDLEAYVLSRLAAAGIGRVEALAADTYARADHFFSYRRATHLDEPSYGRQLSLIGIK